MGRTASPVTPGTNPTPDAPEAEASPVTPGTNPTPDAPEAEASPVTPGAGETNTAAAGTDLSETVKAQAAEIAELKAMMRTIARNQVAVAVPEKVVLPTMASVLESKPTIPVLTEDGWYVPPVHPTDRKVS